MANHLKLTAGAWTTYTGDFAGIPFVNGVSAAPLVRWQIDKIAALVPADLVDASGTTADGQAGVQVRIAGMGHIPAGNGVANTTRPATQAEIDADAAQRAQVAPKPPARFYSKSELEQIAQKGGIKAIREISDPWGLRARDITKLIDMTIGAQNAYQARQASVKSRNDALRAKASADAISKEQARIAAIDAKAKLVQPGGTSNAIGADGSNVTINVSGTVNIAAPDTVNVTAAETAAAADAAVKLASALGVGPAAPAADTATPATPPAS